MCCCAVRRVSSVRTMCGNTNELRDVDASFGESCLFLLSGFKLSMDPGIGLPGDRDNNH